jgi:hypothetical protein
MSALPPIATGKADIGKLLCLLPPRKRTQCTEANLLLALAIREIGLLARNAFIHSVIAIANNQTNIGNNAYE